MTAMSELPAGVQVPPTSLSGLSAGEWSQITCRWHRGIDWNIHKLGRQWLIGGRLGQGAPYFKTKKAAYAYADNLVCWEARYRSQNRV